MKQTRKLMAAKRIARLNKMQAADSDLYELLQKASFVWDARQGEWLNIQDEEAGRPTDLLRVRVWSDIEIVEEFADLIQAKLAEQFPFVERSLVYPCRPPKQLEGRVYLTFKITPLPQADSNTKACGRSARTHAHARGDK